MTPISFTGQNAVLGEGQEEYDPLPVHRLDSHNGQITACWKLSWKERLSVLVHGKIWHQVLTFNKPLQPQLLLTENPLTTVWDK